MGPGGCRAAGASLWFADLSAQPRTRVTQLHIRVLGFQRVGQTPQTIEQKTLDSEWREKHTPREDEKVTSKLGRAGGEVWGKADTLRLRLLDVPLRKIKFSAVL